MRTAPLTLSAKARRTPESPISHFMELALGNPHLISLAAGMVDGASLPAGPVAQAVADLLADPASARAALQYGTTQGYGPLVRQLVKHRAGRDGRPPPAPGRDRQALRRPAAHPDPGGRRLPGAAVRGRRDRQRQVVRPGEPVRRLRRDLLEAVRPGPEDRLRPDADGVGRAVGADEGEP